MATYFSHGSSEIQADGLQTLYLMNPTYVGYSDTQPPANMAFLDSSGNTLNPAHLSQSPQQNQHLVGIPLQATAATAAVRSASLSSQDPNRPSVHGFLPRVRYNLWTTPRSNQIPATAAAAVNNSGSIADVACQLGLRRSVVAPSQQGLSLSLSSEQPAYGSYRSDSDIPAPAPAPVISRTCGDEIQVSGGSPSSVSGISNGNSGVQSVLLGSKYLKVAQQLLDEVVNVGKGIKTELSKRAKEKMKISGGESVTEIGEGSIGGEMSVKHGAELTTGEKQELQMKKAKLVSMFDEVEQRYKRYHHQMQIVISSFQQLAGFGSAKTYTALALQTISKQFRCLKEAISGQIRATSKSLGEEDCLGAKVEGSRLKFVDQQLRQQQAFQQLGVIQHNAWRPQRGLPERSVSILRAWLFEHFLHPYPKDSDKVMLAKQTGLTRSQVSNWFINARVRLWKPMIEEMYMKETKDQEQNSLDDKTSKGKPNEEMESMSIAYQDNNLTTADQTKNLKSKQDRPAVSNAPTIVISNSTVITSTMEENIRPQAGFFLMGSSEADGFLQGNTKKSRNTELQYSPSSIQSINMDMKPDEMNREICLKFGNERQSRDGYFLTPGMVNNGGGFGAYPMEEAERFDQGQFSPRFSGNGVSLTLGLPHVENLPLPQDRHSYLSNQNIQMGRKLEMGSGKPDEFCGISNISPPHHSTIAYENFNIQNRKRFAAQFVPDFIA